MMELERKFSLGEWSQLSEDDVKRFMVNDMAVELASKLYDQADIVVYQNIEYNEFTVLVTVDESKSEPSELDKMIGSVPLYKELSADGSTDFFIEGRNGEQVNVTELVNALKRRNEK